MAHPSWRERFVAAGCAGPVRVLEALECADLLRRLAAAPPAADWAKGHGASSPAFHEIATRPAILDRVVELLGDDVLLWGASLLRRQPGKVHPWHADAESSAPDGRTVSVWIGLQGTCRASALRVVHGSHRAGVTVQEVAARRGRARGGFGDEEVAAWARELEPAAEVAAFDAADGDAIFFDGRLWHGSHNTSDATPRVALLLQYATPRTPIRIPDPASFGWPFRFHPAPEPPCVMVHGTGLDSPNRLVPPPRPTGGGGSTLSAAIRRLGLPLAEDSERGWKVYRQMSGTTPCLRKLGCHVSVLSPGRSPHPPHQHVEEELLLVLDGAVELVLPEGEDDPEPAIRPLAAGSFAYYPSWRWHTLRNVAPRPATYLMFKWVAAEAAAGDRPLGTTVCVDDGWSEPTALGAAPEPWAKRKLLRGPTRWLRRLSAHASVLQPGAGYPAHADAHDVAIVVRRGEVETMGHRLGPGDLAWFAAGEPHDMRNVGDGVAAYLVFELHGHRSRPRPQAPPTWKSRLAAALPGPVERLARRALRRLRGGR